MRRIEDTETPVVTEGPRASWELGTVPTTIKPIPASASPNSSSGSALGSHCRFLYAEQSQGTVDWDFGPSCPAWLKVTRPLEVPGRREEGNCGSKEVSDPGSKGACLLPEAIGWCSPDRGANSCREVRGACGGGGPRRGHRGGGRSEAGTVWPTAEQLLCAAGDRCVAPSPA